MKKDEGENSTPFKEENDQRFALSPDLQGYIPVDDRREEWERDSKEEPTTKDERQAFYQQRIKLVESSKGSFRKDELLHNLKESVKRVESMDDSEAGPESEPIPGGVGFGAYYEDGALTFDRSSMLRYNIVVNPQIGNPQNHFLYLTATNRSPKGVEAYVSYKQQDNPKFKVFDWSKDGDDQFALTRRYELLADYLGHHEAGGQVYQTLHVSNSTRRLEAPESWINEVMLLNRQTGNYDLVYSNEYELAQTDEDNYKFWGPIVETFPPFPFTINNVGFFEAQLLQDDRPAKLLTPDVTHFHVDHAGYQVVLQEDNYSFIVHW